jgi:hypothetical protein
VHPTVLCLADRFPAVFEGELRTRAIESVTFELIA